MNVKVQYGIAQHGMFRILIAENGFFCRDSPVNPKRLVLDVDAAIGLGMIELVAFLLKDSRVGKDGEAMGKTARNEELPMVLFRQLHGYVPAECRGSIAYIHGHIQYSPLDAPDQLTLGVGHTLIVKAAHHAVGRHGFVVLHEMNTMPQNGRHFFVKFTLRKRFKEVSSRVVEYTRLYDEHSFYGCFNDFHISFYSEMNIRSFFVTLVCFLEMYPNKYIL